MNSVSKIAFIILVIIFSSQPSYAENDGGDNWFGKDKIEHFTVSAFYSGGIAVVADRHFDMQRDDAVLVGVGITISLGSAKEVYDSSRPDETSSIKDLIWDVGGALVGGIIAALVL